MTGEPVWLLPGDPPARVSLPYLLAGRIVAQARAQHHHDQADAAAAHRERVDQLGAVLDVADDVVRLLGVAIAVEVLALYPPAVRPSLPERDPQLVDALLHWWADRTNRVLADQAREVLVDRHDDTPGPSKPICCSRIASLRAGHWCVAAQNSRRGHIPETVHSTRSASVHGRADSGERRISTTVRSDRRLDRLAASINWPLNAPQHAAAAGA